MEDKQKAYREKILAQVRNKEKEISEKAKIKRQYNRKFVELEHDNKVREFKKLHPGKQLSKRKMIRNGEYVITEVCLLEENNHLIIEKKAKEEKWNRINAWKEKMQKAGIKAKPRRYFKSPTDLSIHTHFKCKVPAFAKRKGE